MIDTLFSVIEDIYFQVIDDSLPEGSNENNKISFSDASLLPLIEEFREKARNTPYIGKSGNQFKLLKVAACFLNYIMYGDDGVITTDEEELMSQFIKNKLSKLNSDEKSDLQNCFKSRISLHEIRDYIKTHELPLRSIDLITETLIDQIDEERYFLPLEAMYKMLIESV